jgi:hypothetical protein
MSIVKKIKNKILEELMLILWNADQSLHALSTSAYWLDFHTLLYYHHLVNWPDVQASEQLKKEKK